MTSILLMLLACAKDETATVPADDDDLDDDGVTEDLDCDDTNAAVYPGATEVDWDGVDQNCDGIDSDAASLRSVGVSVSGLHAGSGLGFLSLGAGDLDGDGRDDALVGAGYISSNYESAVDEVWLTTGASGSPMLSTEVHGEVGALSSLDVVADGDGLVTLFGNESHVYGFTGQWSSDLSVADFQIQYETDGYPMALAHGDLNSDGVQDYIFSNYWRQEVMVHTGPLMPTGSALEADFRAFASADDYNKFGYSAAAGDVNGDGHSDLVVSAPDEPEGVDLGSVYVFDGPMLGESRGTDLAWARYSGEHERDSVGQGGQRALRVEEVTGDAQLDLVIPANGRLWLITEPSAGAHVLTDAVPHLDNEEIGAGIGTAVTTGPDLNGNGAPELLVSGADWWYPGAIFGFDLPLDPNRLSVAGAAYAIVGDTNGDQAGASLAAGDFDGDGRVDALIGATGVDVPDYEDAGTVTLVLAGALAP
jgi:hypothetical protein